MSDTVMQVWESSRLHGLSWPEDAEHALVFHMCWSLSARGLNPGKAGGLKRLEAVAREGTGLAAASAASSALLVAQSIIA